MAERQAFFEHGNNADIEGQVKSVYSSAGDKYRLTLINISGVENWFNPSESPKSVKKRSILLVPCSKHVRLSDMDLESGEWLRDVEVHNQDGTVSSYKKGESSGQLLRGWRTALLQCSPDERARVLDNITVWGQPRAWTDEKIASWMIEFIASEYGQCLAFGDCLASQWSEAVCLRAWLSGVVWAPYAPDVTSWLQEPDTHEHSQLKS